MPDLIEKFEKAAKEISSKENSIRECVYCAFVDHLSDINPDDLPWEIRIFYESVKIRLTSTVPSGAINDDEANWIARNVEYVELTAEKDFKHEFMAAMSIPHMEDEFPHLKGLVPDDVLHQALTPEGSHLKSLVRLVGDLTTVRPIICEVGILPRTHGSGLFTRGETQALIGPEYPRA